ncbi:hypothetical protein LCGC14_2840310, partial [marine sediment metagenome]
FLVLDEADQMLSVNMPFVLSILERMASRIS